MDKFEFDSTKLESDGYLYQRHEFSTQEELMTKVKEIAFFLGDASCDLAVLEAEEAPGLEVHVECLYQADLPDYFILDCINPSCLGGETQIYDGRVAATIVQEEFPELLCVSIEYTSLALGLFATHPLVVERHSSQGGYSTLLFREKVVTNRIPELPYGWDEASFYVYMKGVLKRSLMVSHEWRAGDILVVNNRFTLHGRSAFSGLRRLIRLRP